MSLLAGFRADVCRSSDDDSDDEDETAALMAELAKIKQERAEEKARMVSRSLAHIHSEMSSPAQLCQSLV